MHWLEVDRVARDVIAAAVRMYDRGFVTGTAGNLSARCGEDMLLTPTRRFYDGLDPGDLVIVPIDRAEPRDSPPQASREWRMHAAIYQARPDVHAIVHTHSPYATARSFDPAPLQFITEERSYLNLDSIEVAPEASSGKRQLACRAVKYLGPRAAVLLARHGVVAVGATPRSALEICSAIEHQAQIQSLLNGARHPG